MKKLCILMLPCLLLAGIVHAQFTTPDNATLQALIQDPAKIGDVIASASEEQSAMVIIQVISLMQAEKMDVAVIQNAVGVMFQKTAEVKGAVFGSTVVSLVKKQVNPRLLPIIRIGGGAPAASPPAGLSSPLYPNQ